MQLRLNDAEKLISSIKAAFADVVYPGDDNITISQCHCSECGDTRDFFQGKHWQEIADTGHLMQYCWGGLSILSAQAWHFYLPAYLIIGIDEGTEDYNQLSSAETARETLISNLSPRGRTGPLVRWFEERVAILSEEQRACLALYATQTYTDRIAELGKLLEPEDMKCENLEDEDYKAVAGFWSQFTSL